MVEPVQGSSKKVSWVQEDSGKAFHFLFVTLQQLWLPGAHQQDSLSPILSLGVKRFPSRFIYRMALRGGFARIQFKDPIKTELDRVYCFTSHSPMRRARN